MLRLAAAALACAPCLAQSTVYVDVANGVDTASGIDPLDPVRTITRGLALTAELGDVPGSVVLVAPGAYEAPDEQFPLQLSAGVTLAALEPDRRPRVSGGPVSFPTALVSATPGTAADTVVRGMDLSNGDRAVQTVPLSAGRLVVVDCEIRDCGTGIDVRPTAAANGVAVVEGTTIVGCLTGVRAESAPRLVVRDTAIEGSGGAGVFVRDVDSSDVHAWVRGGSVGVVALGLTRPTSLTFSGAAVDALIGVRVQGFGAQAAHVDAVHATIAGNDVGVDLAGGAGSTFYLERSILHVNGIDVTGASLQASAAHSFVPSTALTGPGVYLVDPGLRDPVHGDYSLRRGALAIDGINVASSAEAEDGDLDTIARRDYGGYEYRALRPLGDTLLGAVLDLEVDGLAGAYAVGVLDRSGSPAAAIDTLSGRLDLNPLTAERVARIPIDAATGVGHWALPIPPDPALAGTTWRVQALSRSAVSPTGFAFTNSVSLVLR